MRVSVILLCLFILVIPAMPHAQTESPIQALGSAERLDLLLEGSLFRWITPLAPGKLEEAIARAQEQNDAKIQFTLGYMYQHGEGIDRHFPHAEKWYARSAKNGYAPAMVALGRLYKLDG